MCGFHSGVSQDRLVTVEDLEAVVIHLSKTNVWAGKGYCGRSSGSARDPGLTVGRQTHGKAVGEVVAALVSQSSGAIRRCRKAMVLKPSYFVSAVVGLFVGFPRHKRVVDSFARCLLRRVDYLSIAGCGLSSLWDHWKETENSRLKQKYRIMTKRPLLNESCHCVSANEVRRIRYECMSEPPVY